jgi:predicted nucleic acid-binding protein
VTAGGAPGRRLYVETSALLRALLEGDDFLDPELAKGGLFTSALTFLEASRAIARARRERRLDGAEGIEVERMLASFERACDVLALEPEVLRRAREPFPEEPIRSLDALHLASLLVLDEALGAFVIASCDDRVRRNALALGFEVVPAAGG